MSPAEPNFILQAIYLVVPWDWTGGFLLAHTVRLDVGVSPVAMPALVLRLFSQSQEMLES